MHRSSVIALVLKHVLQTLCVKQFSYIVLLLLPVWLCTAVM